MGFDLLIRGARLPEAVDALRGIAPTPGAWNRGRRSFTRGATVLHRP